MMNYVNLTEVMEQLSRHLLKIEVVFFFSAKFSLPRASMMVSPSSKWKGSLEV